MTTDDIKNKVLAQIHDGRVHMRSRAYFAAQLAALAAVALVALVATIFIVNFILFSVRLNRQDVLLTMGPHGWSAFIQFFPWGWLVLDVGLVFLLQWMLRTLRFGWRIPVLYLFGGLCALALGAGVLLELTPLNDDLFEMRHTLPPPVRGVYEGARHHDIDDTLQQFGIPLPPDEDDR